MVGSRPPRDVHLHEREGTLAATFEALGSPCEILYEADTASEVRRFGEIAAAEAWRIEDKFSRYLRGNIVHRINSAAGQAVRVDPEAASLIDFGAALYELSGGAFDITSGVLRKAWTFDGSDRIPTDEAIAAAMARVGWHRAAWHPPELTLEPGMEIDFGGIGKEYAVDRVAALIRAETTIGALVNFGGDLAVARPRAAGAAWKVGIEAVMSPQSGTMIELLSGALATSGDARRFLVCDGVRYGHILDPTTGWPVMNAPHSITVAADTCTQAGMLCTLAMLKGADAEKFLAAEGVRHWCRR